MKQISYDMIIACIQYGVPAISTQLIQELNVIVAESNKLREMTAHIESEKDKIEKTEEGE